MTDSDVTVIDSPHDPLAYYIAHNLVRSVFEALWRPSSLWALPDVVWCDRLPVARTLMELRIIHECPPYDRYATLTPHGKVVRSAVRDLHDAPRYSVLRHQMLSWVARGGIHAVLTKDGRVFHLTTRQHFLRPNETRTANELAMASLILWEPLAHPRTNSPAPATLSPLGARILMLWDAVHQREGLCPPPLMDMTEKDRIPPTETLLRIPTREIVERYPQYYRHPGPGHVLASRLSCPHRVPLTDPCERC